MSDLHDDDPCADQRLEAELRRALRPVAPAPGFAGRVGRRLRAARPGSAVRRMALAAALLAALAGVLIAGNRQMQQRQTERAAAVHAQLIQALRVTSRSLNDVQRRLAEAGKRT